ncbi:hypothetical protein CGLO_14911 [Colletotrichum gloeosporioides Cg-14]|uniref:Uncharacterized protein n=1 Tax=Colletotrichum gloeosporioides (strain Cg-14) TaxID=1237896 RepID=T0JZX1_COLGC|nr:hypothetical protein CGLO_14911 [Colletotrichum gloeosporioides Cg-14]
MHFKVGFNFNN